MPEIVISDTSCIIILDKIRALHFLQLLYQRIITTPEVAKEFGKHLPPWIELKVPSNQNYQKLLETHLDNGEASAIALALENDNALLLLDDLKARKVAKQLGLRFTGTLGVITKAKQEGHIDRMKPYLLLLKETNFRIADHIIEELIRIDEG